MALRSTATPKGTEALAPTSLRFASLRWAWLGLAWLGLAWLGFAFFVVEALRRVSAAFVAPPCTHAFHLFASVSLLCWLVSRAARRFTMCRTSRRHFSIQQ